MSNKQMYFKVNVKDWNQLSANEKCIVNNALNNMLISARAEYSPEHVYTSSAYRLGLTNDGALTLAYLDSEGDITWDSEVMPTGLIKHSNLEVLAIEDDMENFIKLSDLEVIPEIDGVENTDDTCKLSDATEEDPYIQIECVPVDSKVNPVYHLRSSSFGLKFNNIVKGVYFKLALVPMNERDVESIKTYLKSYTGEDPELEQQPLMSINCDSDKGDISVTITENNINWLIARNTESGSEFDKFNNDISSKINDDGGFCGLIYCKLCHDEDGSEVKDVPDASNFKLYVNGNVADTWIPVSGSDTVFVPLIITDLNIDGGNIPSLVQLEPETH